MSDQSLSPEHEQRLRDAFARIPFAQFLGIKLDELRPGRASLSIELRDELKRNNGVTHGGVVASLVDSAAAFAILTVLTAGESTTTIDLTIHYLRPLIEGRVTSEAKMVRAGRRVLVVSIDVWDPAGRLAATALTSFIKTL